VRYLSWEVCGRSIALMAAKAAGYFSLVILSESLTLKTYRTGAELLLVNAILLYIFISQSVYMLICNAVQ
jgi:hypothetical protein